MKKLMAFLAGFFLPILLGLSTFSLADEPQPAQAQASGTALQAYLPSIPHGSQVQEQHSWTRGAPGWCQEWITVTQPADPQVLEFPYLDRTAWCADIWTDQGLVTLLGSGWCDGQGCAAVCDQGICAAGLNPQASTVTISGSGDQSELIQRLTIYTVAGRPTPVPTQPGQGQEQAPAP